MGKKILVTGGAGFIGSHLTRRLLERGDSITIIDDFNDFYDPTRKRANVASLGPESVRVVEADIRDREAVDGLFSSEAFDAVVHLAARAGVRPSLAEPILYEEVNCIGTLHLLEAARRHGPRVFVFGSSSSVYGINKKVPFAESDEVNHPISPYATTKRTGELLCYNYHHLYGLRTSCLRFFTVYGPAQRPEMAIHKFTDLIANGNPVPLFGNGESRRDYTYIDDIIDGVVAALDLEPAFEIINLGGAETTRLSDLVTWIGDELGVEPTIEHLPDQPGDVPITYADVSKARSLLDYEPRVPIREGLRQFVEWYRRRKVSTPTT
jgi:UDP-glucuronate 4-epimerase